MTARKEIAVCYAHKEICVLKLRKSKEKCVTLNSIHQTSFFKGKVTLFGSIQHNK